MSREDPDFLDSVEKAFRLLRVFSADVPELTVSRAAELTGLTRPTARRLLMTFLRLRLVECDRGVYRLTPRVLTIGHSYLSSLPLWDHAQGRLRALAEEINEACSAATLDDKDIVYVARVPAKRSMSLTLTIGSRLPAYPTSMGRVLLASLSDDAFEQYLATTTFEELTPHTVTDKARFREIVAEVRQHGYAIVDGERELGVRSAAAPVLSRAGTPIAAMNVSVNAARVSLAELTHSLVPKLQEAADDISKNIVAHL